MYTLRDGKIYYKSDFSLGIEEDKEVEVDQVMGEKVTPLNATYLFKKLTGISEATDDATTLTSEEAGILTSYPWAAERTSTGWKKDSTGTTVITAEISDAIDALDTLGSRIKTDVSDRIDTATISSFDSFYKDHFELENYRIKYKSWFPDRELDGDSFKTLPSDIAKETMQLFCVEVVSDLIENLFKEALDNQIRKKAYAVNRLGECKATYDIVHTAIERFKLDRKVLKQLLNKTITESKEKFRPRIDIDAAAGLFFETKIDWDHIDIVSLAFTFDLLDGYVLYIAKEGTGTEMTKSWEL